MEGDAKFTLSEFTFERKVDYNSESSVVITDNGFVIKGVEFKREGYLEYTTNNKEVVISIGNFKEIIHRDSIFEINKRIKDSNINSFEDIRNSFKDFIDANDPLENVVRKASFEDRGIKSVGIDPNVPFLDEIEGSFGNAELLFNNKGELTHIRKKDDQWAPLTLGKRDTILGEIYRDSSPFVKNLIDDSGKMKLSYKDISDRFYDNSILKAGGREIKIDSYQDNFIVMNGDNLGLGGELSRGSKQRVKILKDLNSITGFNAHGFVNFGISKDESESLFLMDGNNLQITRLPLKEVFTVDDISLVVNGKASKFSWHIAQDEKGKFYADKSGILIAGREVFKGPLGSFVDIHVDLDRSDYENKVRPFVKEESSEIFGIREPGEALVKSMLDSKFSFNIDIKLPGDNLIKLNTEKGEKLIVDVDKRIDDFIFRGTLKESTASTIDDIKNKIFSTIRGFGSIESGNINIAVKNNPGKNPSIAISDGEIAEFQLNKNEASLMKDVLEGVLRFPDINRGKLKEIEDIQTTVPYLPNKKTFYWPPGYLKSLWYYNLGKETSISGSKDKDFLNNLKIYLK